MSLTLPRTRREWLSGRAFRSIVLSCTSMLLLGWNDCSANAARRPRIDVFSLTATAGDFKDYHPTYLANGYWSMASSVRGSDPTPAQMSGLMDYSPHDVSRPAAIPSWNEIDYFDGDQWLNSAPVDRQSFTSYHQTLAMHDGTLQTRYRWRDGSRITDVSVESFVSQSDPHLGVASMQLTPHFSGIVRLRLTLRVPPPTQRLPLADMSAAEFEAAAVADNRPELATGGNRRAIWYLGTVDVTASDSDAPSAMLWMNGRAVGGRAVSLGAAIAYPKNLAGVHVVATHGERSNGIDIEARVRSGHTYRFTKFVAATAEGWNGTPDDNVVDALPLARRARDAGLTMARQAHREAWHRLWRADIRVGGDPELQRTLHSDIFYMLENSTAGTSWPVGGCGFSGNYFGHVFWDSDFWVFPALLLLDPERAKSLVAFRQRTLPQANARAVTSGFAGAMYPWEADPWNGTDVTPTFAAENARREIHVNGAVALAQWQYYLATGNKQWLRESGFPVIKGVADFWASRVVYDANRKRFEVHDVMSPEEDYPHVDNEIYTNTVARRSLTAAISAADTLGVTPDPLWGEVARGLYEPAAAAHEPYFDFDPTTPHDKTTSWMATSVPMLSIPALDFAAAPETMRGLFQHSVSAIAAVRDRANQMVLVMLAIEAASIGDNNYFHGLMSGSGGSNPAFLRPPFNVRSETPQNDSLYILATSGGFVQAFMYGLTGLRLGSTGLVERFPATLPGSLSYLTLQNIEVRGEKVNVTLTRETSGKVVRRIAPSHDHGV